MNASPPGNRTYGLLSISASYGDVVIKSVWPDGAFERGNGIGHASPGKT